jgi:hypothetical protein
MIIRLYKAGFGFQLIFFSLVVVLLWLDAIISPQPPASFEFNTPLYQIVVTGFSRLPSIVNVLVALILVLTQSYLLNYALAEHKIIPGNTFLVVLVYCVMMSFDPSLLRLHPILIANLFLVLALRIILKIYNEKDTYQHDFNASMLVSIASIIYLPYIFFLIFIWITFLIYRVSKTREWIIVWIGILAPYIYIWVYYFVFDKLELFYTKYIQFFTQLQPVQIKSNGFNYAFGAVMALLTLVSSFRLLNDSGGKVISIRKKIIVLVYLLLISLLTTIYARENLIYHITMVFIALSAIVTYYFTALKKVIWAEIFFTMIVIIIILEKVFI